MKMSKKGFMLTETLVVSTLVSVVLVSLYLQFNTVVRNFEKSFSYNNVNDLYAVYNIERLLQSKNGSSSYFDLMKSKFSGSTYHYLDINCTIDGINSYKLSDCTKFNSLVSFYGIKKVILTNANPSITDQGYANLSCDNNTCTDDPNFEEYLKKIKSVPSNDNLYRIIVKFGNLEYASLVVAE